MADSGLKDMIQMVYLGSSSAEHIFSGGAYAKTIRFPSPFCICRNYQVHDERCYMFSEKKFKEMEDFIKNAKDEKTSNCYLPNL